jgi:hypothetical protein
MGRRSRQRANTPSRERARVSTPATPRAQGSRSSAAVPPATTAARRSRREQAPQAPWGSFPLVELCALAAIVFGVWGIVRGGHGGAILLTAAALLGSVAGLEVAIREHFGGYRSHSLVLAALCGVVTITLLFYAGAERTAMLGIAGAVLVGATVGFRQLFKRRSGGAGMRVR